MPTVDTVLAFAAASIVLLLIPGPAVTLLVNRSVSSGPSVALASVGGVALGNFMHVLAATVGLSAILATSAAGLEHHPRLGAACLIGVGMGTLLLARWGKLDGAVVRASYRRAFTQGFSDRHSSTRKLSRCSSCRFSRTSWIRNWARRGCRHSCLARCWVGLGSVTNGPGHSWPVRVRETLYRGRAMPFVRRYVSGFNLRQFLRIIAARAQRQTA